jgi:predicted nucleic acid-binding protein
VTRLLLDVNLILDVLLDRRPHVTQAARVWSAVELGRAEGLLSAHAVTTIHYLNRRAGHRRVAAETTAALLSVFNVAPVDETVLGEALALDWPDFEDAVTAAAARRAKCHAIVTRHTADFARSPVRVLTPEQAAAWLTVR